MYTSVDDTIAAIASAPGSALRGILRISGRNSMELFDRVFRHQGPPASELIAAGAHWMMVEMNLGEGQYLPGRLLIWPANRSYTRQPSFEFHTLGASALLQMGLQALCQAGARIAMPGEFTLRSFLAGRIDLTQAEAVLGLIDSRSSSEFKLALEQAAGGLKNPFFHLRDRLVDLLADLEASLDFVDEDIEFVTEVQVSELLKSAMVEAESLCQQISRRGGMRNLPRLVFAGRSNAGKSSLFNALLGLERAIVSPWEGTTRDCITAEWHHMGTAAQLVDSAGLDEDITTADTLVETPKQAPSTIGALLPCGDIVNQAGQQTRAAVQTADLVLYCMDVNHALPENVPIGLPSHYVPILTKADTMRTPGEIPGWHLVSSATGYGLAQLADDIVKRLHCLQGMEKSGALPTTTLRCSTAASEALDGLHRALAAHRAKAGVEIVAAEIRECLDHLGQIVGTVYNDDLLARIFSRFCIGK